MADSPLSTATVTSYSNDAAGNTIVTRVTFRVKSHSVASSQRAAPATGGTDGHAGELGERREAVTRHGRLQAREKG